MPSFDAVSELDTHELTNAVDQANRELSQRFDFKDSGASFELNEKERTVSLKAPAEFQLKQMVDILTQRLGKRGIEARCMEKKDPVTNLAEARQDIVLRHGIDMETGKKLQKILKESKVKVQAQIQGDQLRVTGKQRDDLQAAMALLRKADVDRPLQFKNFRD
jgi:cyclic-di-GMP-binding protein